MSASPDPEAVPGGAAPADSGIAGALVLYGLARLGLLALIAGLLLLAGTPLLIALLVALVVALPLSMVLFRGLRARLDSALAVSRARRGAQRAALREGLRGDPEPQGSPEEPHERHVRREGPDESAARRTDSGDRPERQPDGRGR